MSKTIALVSQYELLEVTASRLTIFDLLNLAYTCSELYAQIRRSEAIFEKLKRIALCDGRGLEARQEYRGVYFISQEHLGSKWAPNYDEELEVRVWNLKCDAANVPPCLRCGINVCEECRYMPRVRDGFDYSSRRRPHLDPTYSSHTIRCYCKERDEEVERSLPLRLSEVCDCDQYTRWICLKFKAEEIDSDAVYYSTKTMSEYLYPTIGDDGERDDGMWLQDHQKDRVSWCPCGKRAPSNGNIRCAWCLRKHKTTPKKPS